MSKNKEVVRALYESEQRFRMLVQGVRDYAIYMLDRNGYITNWNTGASVIKGYSAEEIIGQHFSRFYTPEDRASGEPERGLAAALEHNTFQNEGWRVRKDGSHFWASIVIDPIHDEHGEFIGFAKITRDITARKRAQDELDSRREALNQAQKMEALGRLTGGVAHDFNNLLTIIRSSAELLKMDSLPAEKRSRYIDAIADTADRAALLTRQLLAFARQQPLRPELFNARTQIDGLSKILGASLGPNIKLDVDFSRDMAAVEADASQFDTAILNIIINARDAMPQGGVVRITAENVTHIPPVHGQAGTWGAFVAISLADTGTGIDGAVLPRIFEPFFTTKAVNRGTGLGLSQVYGFAKQSGGEVTVESRANEGTTFTLYLPSSLSESPPPTKHEKPGNHIPVIGSSNVLLVEDNKVVGQFAEGLLTELGQNVTLAADGHAALAILQARPGAFDLVISDVVMPGISGIDLGKEIRRHWPGLRIVLTSGYSHILSREGSHGFEFLPKPYSLANLMAIIQGRALSDT